MEISICCGVYEYTYIKNLFILKKQQWKNRIVPMITMKVVHDIIKRGEVWESRDKDGHIPSYFEVS